jgi:hypothetical protein
VAHTCSLCPETEACYACCTAQVNEVFVEKGTVAQPLQVPAAELARQGAELACTSGAGGGWRQVYLGTSIAYISRDLSRAQVGGLVLLVPCGLAAGMPCVRVYECHACSPYVALLWALQGWEAMRSPSLLVAACLSSNCASYGGLPDWRQW